MLTNLNFRSSVLSTIKFELPPDTHCWNLNFCCKIESFIHHLPTEVLERKSVSMTCPNCQAYIRTQLKYLVNANEFLERVTCRLITKCFQKLHPRKKFRKFAHCLAPMFSCILCNRFRKIIHMCPFCGIALGVSNVFDCI